MRKTWIVGAALVGCASHFGTPAQPSEGWDIVLNGRAVHLNATHDWNEDNWGLGFEREFSRRGPWVTVALANAFEDSVGDPSYMAGGGLKRRFEIGRRNFYVDVGGVAFAMVREKVNGGNPFPGVLPAATLGFKRIAVNVTYMPEAVVNRVTDSNRHDPTMEGVFFLQLKLDSSLFSGGSGRRFLFAQETAR
jgi:hypothetical protein